MGKIKQSIYIGGFFFYLIWFGFLLLFNLLNTSSVQTLSPSSRQEILRSNTNGKYIFTNGVAGAIFCK